MSFFVPNFHNPGILTSKLPKSLFDHMLSAIKDERAKQVPFNNLLVGSIEQEFLTPYVPEFHRFLSDMYLEWRKIFNEPIVDYKITPVWTNYMKKNEFNPNHHHHGLAVFVLWMQIPYNIEDELNYGSYSNKTESCKNSCFEFFYSTMSNVTSTHLMPVSKKDEGTILMFPSNLWHCVYPFRTSDGERISIAGNIQKK